MNNVLILIPDQLQKPMGGMGEQARNLLASFPDGYNFMVIGSAQAKEYHEGCVHFCPVSDINTMNGNPDPLSQTFLNQSLFIERALGLNCKPDLIHAFDWSTFWAGRILSRHFKIPLVTTVQLSIEKHITEIHPLQRMQYDMACSIEMSGLIGSDAIIQVSESYAKLFHKFLMPKTTVIHNGINLEDWVQENKIQLPGKPENKKLVYIGRYAEMKNIQTLLQCDIPENVDLIFIGDSRGGSGNLFDSMVKLSREKENIHFVGSKYGQQKVDWLCSADAVITPSIHEPFGIVALEALASKSILLSSFVNGMGDFLTVDAAINCGTSKKSIEAAIFKLVNLSNEEKESYIKNGLEICKNHHWSLQAEKLHKVYTSVLNEKKNRLS